MHALRGRAGVVSSTRAGPYGRKTVAWLPCGWQYLLMVVSPSPSHT